MAKTGNIRLLNTKNVLSKKFTKFDKLTGIFKSVLGEPESYGIWLIYGAEKNGKTWFSLMLAVHLSKLAKVLYISAEEGVSSNFQDTLSRINLDHDNRSLYYSDYLELEEIREILGRKKGRPAVIFFDNVTVYNDVLKNGTVRRLQLEYQYVLFIYIGHEEKGDVYLATGKLIKRMAKVIFYVQGLRVTVGGRCPGGDVDIDTEKAALYYGQRA
ncbi:hypothetical protein [Sphingobacterium luzhongxinii]|uniref:hypothetical protein n=1 Tax=Sphingobacterium luzhongxinii TaxID=2654181 RepID=UPI0013DCC000|nr:hypothetical protein [Sphingobacterium sp. xlx-73]